MTESEAREQLGRVFDAYPTFRTELARSGDGATTGTLWARMLVHCDLDDVRVIVDQIVSGDREPYGRYEKWDSLPRTIRTAAIDIRSRRNARERQQAKYHDVFSEPKETDERFGQAWRLAEQIGLCVRDKIMTVEENNELMDAVHKWHRGGAEFPAWVLDVVDERRKSDRKVTA